MIKAVVTGGAGFIGSHLTEGLVREGYRVTVLDDLSTGKMENIRDISSDVEFIKGSITEVPLLQKLFRGIDYVFHLAAVSSVPRSILDPLVAHNINATGTLNVLVAARDNGIKKVIFSSSAAVYGDTVALPLKEDTLPAPLSPYAVTKLTGEYYCRVFQEVYKLPAVSLRYFNVYGPRQDPASQYAAAIPKFIKSVIELKPPVIFGDGEQTRDFVFVKDVISANILAARASATGVFNISQGESTTVNRLADIIIDIGGGGIAPVHQEPRAGDIRHSVADISKARTFGYAPQYDIKTGLQETFRWFAGSSAT